MDAELAEQVVAELIDGGLTLACAESLTGGMLAGAITSVPGASAAFIGGVIGYATRVKRDLLGVTVDSVISAECAEQMAVGVRRLLGADCALATTGVAGPDRQEGQPPGTVYVALAGPDRTSSERLALLGSRSDVRDQTCDAALRLLLQGMAGARPGTSPS